MGTHAHQIHTAGADYILSLNQIIHAVSTGGTVVSANAGGWLPHPT